MKKSKEQIQKEKIAVYFGMIGLTTPEINRRAKLLVKKGLLSIDKSKTSNSCGVCYRLIKFESIKVDDLTFDMLVLNILPNISKLIENSNSFRSIDTLQTE